MFTKLSVCIDIVEIWFGIANVQILSNFDKVICLRHAHILFPDDNLSKCQRLLTKLGTCIGIKEVCSGLLGVICWQHDNGGVFLFYVFILHLS